MCWLAALTGAVSLILFEWPPRGPPKTPKDLQGVPKGAPRDPQRTPTSPFLVLKNSSPGMTRLGARAREGAGGAVRMESR